MKALAAGLLGAAAGAFLVANLAAGTVAKAQLQAAGLGRQLIACEQRPASP